MTTYQMAQTLTGLRWGTMMPVAVRIGGAIAQIRARGTFSVRVTDPSLLAQSVPDPENLARIMSMQATAAITDWIGMRSMSSSSTAEVTAINAEGTQEFFDLLAPRLASMGVELTAALIEAVENM